MQFSNIPYQIILSISIGHLLLEHEIGQVTFWYHNFGDVQLQSG